MRLLNSIVLAIVIAFLSCSAVLAADQKETAYERVMRTGILRCGYFAESPFTIIDPNTNKKSGIAVELAETIASQIGLKLEWTEEVNFGTLVTDLQSGRYDAICASVFNIPRAGKIDYTTPYIYMPSLAYVRPDEKRFDNNLSAINKKDVTVAILDGEGSSTIANRLYPDAKKYDLPQSDQIAQMLLAVADKKADVGFVMPTVFADFNKTNPGKLKQVNTKDPFYVFSLSFAIRPNEPQLKDMLDIMINQLIVSGEMDRIIDKYETKPKTFLRVAKPYR
jgi:polar amino acid transport system substrate-binding protein